MASEAALEATKSAEKFQEIYYGNHRFLLKHTEQYEELFTDIFEQGMSEISADVSDLQMVMMDDKIEDIQKYLYDMEL